MTRLATWMPFARAVKEVGYFRHTSVTEATVRRQTEAAGAAYVAVQEQEVERLERDAPLAPKGPTQQFVSVDGAFVPLVGGEWAEVKTLAIGEVEAPKQVKDGDRDSDSGVVLLFTPHRLDHLSTLGAGGNPSPRR